MADSVLQVTESWAEPGNEAALVADSVQQVTESWAEPGNEATGK